VRPLIARGVSVVFALMPVIVTLIAAAIATSNGCGLDEGSPHPCIVHGGDIGDTLYSMGLMLWFGMLTVPVARRDAIQPDGESHTRCRKQYQRSRRQQRQEDARDPQPEQDRARGE
jgi:hypothetical protein